MKHISLSLLAFMFVSTSSFAGNTPLPNNEPKVKPIEIISLAQLPEIGKNIDIEVTRKIYGEKSFFSSFLGSDDSAWMRKVKIDVDLTHCFSNEHIKTLEPYGYYFKSRNADGLVIGFREALKMLKDDGVKYILLGSQRIDEKDKEYYIKKNLSMPGNSIQTGVPFKDFFISLLTDKFPHDQRYTDTFADIETGAMMAWNDRCQPMTTNAVLSLVGQIASHALGIAGARAGNTSMTSLAANSNYVFSRPSQPQVVGVREGKESGIARKAFVQMYGVMDPKYFDNHMKDMGVKGYLFPISEVEEHLAQYTVLPYSVGLIKSDWF